MKTISYRRVSTDEQSASGLGLDAQYAAIVKYIGHEPDHDFVDEGISGACADRPGLLAALESLKRGDTLIVAKRDRAARDVFLMCWIEKECKKCGARIVSAAGEGTEDNDPASVLMRRMIDSFAEYERAIIGQRTKAAMAAKKARGESTGRVAFGFRLSADGVHIEPDAQEQEVISIVRTLNAAGYSTRAIAAELERQGHKTRSGSSWRHQYIADILKRAA